jgi:hypothetical protein
MESFICDVADSGEILVLKKSEEGIKWKLGYVQFKEVRSVETFFLVIEGRFGLFISLNAARVFLEFFCLKQKNSTNTRAAFREIDILDRFNSS